MTKILPHHNCLQGEHVFIPNRTMTNTRESWIESFVCTHCLVVINKTQWEVHQQELKRIAEGMEQSDSPTPLESKPYIPTDYKGLGEVYEVKNPPSAPKKPVAKPAPKKA